MRAAVSYFFFFFLPLPPPDLLDLDILRNDLLGGVSFLHFSHSATRRCGAIGDKRSNERVDGGVVFQ